jgi:hypothetical protein
MPLAQAMDDAVAFVEKHAIHGAYLKAVQDIRRIEL